MSEKIDWDYFKECAKAERDAEIIPYVAVSIEKNDKYSERVILHRYDIPRNKLDRYRWIIQN